ncbi:MAG: caspase family protein [Polyangiaceae bacterium]|nr:caspase family protein [Polyangiaceae bacterium]
MKEQTHGANGIKANNTYALLIGVDHYDSFPASELRGSRTDVITLAWYLSPRGVLGVPLENVRALTWPLPTEEELKDNDALSWLRKLPETSRGEARAQGVKNGLIWLLEKAKSEGATVIFAFSGHGAWTQEQGPVLCLGDTAKDFTSGVLALRDLKKMVQEHGVRDRLVALLDCCHVSAQSAGGFTVTALPSRGTAANVEADRRDFDVSDRVLLAAKPGKQAHQMRLGRHAQGAMTFALVTAAERWRASDGVSHGSYKQVLKRAKKVVKGLGVPQKLSLRALPAMRQAIRKEPFLGVKAGATTKTPDALGRGVQIDPNTLDGCSVYKLTLDWANPGSPVEAYVASMGDRDYGDYKANTEYWGGPANFSDSWTAATRSNGNTLTFTFVRTYMNGGPPSGWYGEGNAPWSGFEASDMTNTKYWTWQQMSNGPDNTMWYASTGTGNTVYWGLSFKDGSFTWYCYANSSPPAQNYVVNDETTFRFTSGFPLNDPPSGYAFYQLTPVSG